MLFSSGEVVESGTAPFDYDGDLDRPCWIRDAPEFGLPILEGNQVVGADDVCFVEIAWRVPGVECGQLSAVSWEIESWAFWGARRVRLLLHCGILVDKFSLCWDFGSNFMPL